MTIRQEIYGKLMLLSDSGLRIILPMVDEMLRQGMTAEGSEQQGDQEQKRAAFQRLLQSREQFPFPADYDPEKAREAAMREKYGRFM